MCQPCRLARLSCPCLTAALTRPRLLDRQKVERAHVRRRGEQIRSDLAEGLRDLAPGVGIAGTSVRGFLFRLSVQGSGSDCQTARRPPSTGSTAPWMKLDS